MPEHDDVLVAPEIEMAEPQLLVDHLDQRADLAALPRRNLQVERAADMQRFHIRQPGERDFILRPDPGDEDLDFVLVGAVERPFVERGQALDDIDGVFGPVDGFIHCRGHLSAFGRAMAGHGERTHIRGNEAGGSPESLAGIYIPGSRSDSCKIPDLCSPRKPDAATLPQNLSNESIDSRITAVEKAPPRASLRGRRFALPACRFGCARAPPFRAPPRIPRG